MEKYALVRDLLAQDGIFEFQAAPFADPAVVKLAHDADYVDRFLEGRLDPQAIRRIGFPWSENLVRRTMASVGGSLAAAEQAMLYGWGGNLAGGTHHAFRSEGSGFCVFNDIAIVIQWLRSQGRIQRAAVIDLDVHQGDGTAQIFEDDPDVLTLSMHGRNNFPFRKRKSKIDVELADGVGDEEYLEKLRWVLPQVIQFRPDFVVFQSGVDPLESDTLGRLSLTAKGLSERDRLVLEMCRQYGAPLLVVLGGGYSKPIERTAEAHASTYRMAASVYRSANECRRSTQPRSQSSFSPA
ncbi:MAG: histone deacetylase [Bryobacteraceae bacterium]|nr:histone deacetylase [Bryobacteraceae bacterium]MDW8379803.1 histone deacetylase [Bryobacterales bacterium]